MSGGRVITKVFELVGNIPITFEQLAVNTKENRKSISNSLCHLIHLGYVERSENSSYRLTQQGISLKTSGQEVTFSTGPTKGYLKQHVHRHSLRERVWRLIRLKRKFSIKDLLSIVLNGTEKDPESNIQRYLKALSRTHYISELKMREAGNVKQSNGFKRYVLIKDTGNKAPLLRMQSKEVYDPNTGEISKW